MGIAEDSPRQRPAGVSEVIDASFPDSERQRLLQEVRTHLPAFLHRQTSEHHDPSGDLKELLNLEDDDLEEVKSVHLCLDPVVLAFGAALESGLRHPMTSSIRPPEVAQSVRGPIDWGATVRRRALEAGNSTVFVIRSAQRIFETPENQALAWLLGELAAALARARATSLSDEDAEGEGWFANLRRLAAQLDQSKRSAWLRGVVAVPPTVATLKRLEASRRSFYRSHILPALNAVLAMRNPTEEHLVDALCRRHFRPERNWLLFEVAVALRLARAFAEVSPKPRKTRLLVGAGRATFARYGMPDGSEVSLIYQAWPNDPAPSVRRQTARRHGFDSKSSRPDLFIVRTGPEPDCAILELKATDSPGYLGSGLTQLLGYLGERPGVFKGRPAGWLVAPASTTFSDRTPEADEDLWVIGAESVAEQAVARFA